MTKEMMSGPQQVAIAAEMLGECPHIIGRPSAVKDLTGPHDFEREALLKFAGIKVVTDELADRLPNMQTKFPPHGLPEPDEELQADEGEITSLEHAFAELNARYHAKLVTHVDDELETMVEDPRFKPIIESRHGFDIGIKAGIRNDVDIMTGILSIMPAILGPEMSHDEIITIAKNSRRLAIIPSLQGRSELDAFWFAAGQKDQYDLGPRGLAFEPSIFSIFSDRRTHRTYIDYAGGLGSLDLARYWDFNDKIAKEEYERNVAQGLPGVIDRTSIKNDRPKRLGEFREKYGTKPLTCPARKLIVASWADMIDIADQEHLFELAA